MNILTINLVLSTFVFWVAARIYVVPNLTRWSPQAILVPILLLHSLRHLGLMFRAPGSVYEGMPPQFAYPAAFGDLAAAALAMAAILAGTPRWLVWVFNIVGTVDLLAAITLASVYDAAAFMGRRIGFPLSGCRRCSSRITSCSLS
jgi:hypothetical protein